MKSEKSGEKIIVKMPSRLCPYSRDAVVFVHELGQLAADTHKMSPGPDRGIMLVQDGPAVDWQDSWIAELKESCLFNDLVHRIDAWRWVLSMIRNSPIPWTYAAADDCFGGNWELALSCHHRYWFKASARLGFPELEIGVFPPGGVLESLNKRTGRTRERWQSSPLYSAAAALSDGLIDFCAAASDWPEQAQLIFSNLLRANPRAGVREQRKARERDQFVSVDSQSRRTAYQQIEVVWRQEKFGGASGPTAWDYCWQLVTERARLKQPSDLGKIVGLIASRYMLLPSYSTWLESRRVESVTSDVKATSATVAIPPLTVDLNQGIPPNQVVARLLEEHQNLVFVAADNRDLVSSLNLIFNRLERSLGNVSAQYLWDRGVTWCQGRPRGLTAPVLSWTHDDYMIVSEEGKDLRFLRLEGNSPNASLGLLEFMGDLSSVPQRVRTIVRHVCERVITSSNRNNQPMTMLVRSLFLDELIRVSRAADGDLSTAVTSLNHAGWGFAGTEESWDRFLRIRQAPSTATSVPKAIQYNSEITTWRLAKLAARRHREGDEIRINHIAHSHHMAIYLGSLAKWWLQEHPDSLKDPIDFLFAASLGLPKALGTPLTFLAHRGRRRIEHYITGNWPKLKSRDELNHEQHPT